MLRSRRELFLHGFSAYHLFASFCPLKSPGVVALANARRHQNHREKFLQRRAAAGSMSKQTSGWSSEARFIFPRVVPFFPAALFSYFQLRALQFRKGLRSTTARKLIFG
jgi:hypothetical protein